MSSFEDSESVFAGSVPHSDGLSVIVDVAVLSDSFTIGSSLLPVHCSVLLSERGTESSISGIKSLLLQNLCILWFDKLAIGSGNKTRGSD